MKHVFEITRNGILQGYYENLNLAKQKANVLEKTDITEWKHDERLGYHYAFGQLKNGNRNEYEIQEGYTTLTKFKKSGTKG